MPGDWRSETEPLVLEGSIKMPYSWTVGRTGSRFLIELRDNGRILSSRCPDCDLTWVPPRNRCPKCFRVTREEDWKEVGPEGVIRHLTIVHHEQPAHPLKAPFGHAIIDLDGTNQGFTHLVSCPDPGRLGRGVRVKPCFSEDPRGSILDILYFTPVGG